MSSTWLGAVLQRLGWPENLLAILTAFHPDMNATTQHNDSWSSDKIPIITGVKQGCVLAPFVCGIFLAALLLVGYPKQTFLHTQRSGKLFNV